MSIPVFFLTPTDQVRVRLRRFHGGGLPCDAAGHWCCDASVVIHEAAPAKAWVEDYRDEAFNRTCSRTLSEQVSADDARWPTHCARCGAAFAGGATSQVWAEALHSGSPDGALYTLRDAPVGAMWDAFWMADVPGFTGADGIALMVRTPGGEWHVDSEASNCTRPGDLTHKCWVRHGDPRDPQGLHSGVKLHVDKAGDTCSAGAGSIQCGSYHGFLHQGALV